MNQIIKRHASHAHPKKKILIIGSNPAELKGFPVGVFAEEITRPFFEFIRAGYEVELASPNGGRVEYDFMSDPENENTQNPNDFVSIGFNHHKKFGSLLRNTKPISDVDGSEYDAILVAGGGAPLVTFKDDVQLHRFVADFYEQGKIVSMLCHGSSLLLWTQLSNGELLANGKTWTGFSDGEERLTDEAVGTKVNDYTIESEARKNSATSFEAAGPFEPFAIRDGRLITGQQQMSSAFVAELVIEALSEANGN